MLAAVVFVLLFLCADALTATLAQIFSVPYVWSSPHFLATIANPEMGDIDLPLSSAPVLFMARFIPALVYCGLWSTFLLGALLFRSKSFVLTAVILIAGFTLLSLLGTLGLVSLMGPFPHSFNEQKRRTRDFHFAFAVLAADLGLDCVLHSATVIVCMPVRR